jgi:hypothetical protein
MVQSITLDPALTKAFFCPQVKLSYLRDVTNNAIIDPNIATGPDFSSYFLLRK